MHLDLDDALDALDAVALAGSGRHLLARHADLWAYRILRPLCASEATLAFAALPLNAQRLVGLLVETGWRCRSVVQVAGASPRGAAAFIGFADTVDWLPAERVAADTTRREELLRRFAAFNHAQVLRGGQPEDAKRSARVLDRLDYRSVLVEEARLEESRAVASAIEDVNRRIRAGGPL